MFNRELSIENSLIKLTEHILHQRSLGTFQNQIEKTFGQFFDCERVTVVMVQRVKKFMYRILKDEKTGEDSIKRFDFDAGFIGYVN